MKRDDLKTHLFTYRHEKGEWLRFVATATMHDITPTEIFKKTVKSYLEANQSEAVKRMTD
jgi:hypothetical protein